MRGMRLALAVVIVALVVPELPRYWGERRLRQVTTNAAALREGVGAVEQRQRQLRGLSVVAARIRTFPGDWRPLDAAASASLFGKDASNAIRLYGHCLALGERPELVYDLGVAYMNARDSLNADAAFLRAAWLSPAIAQQLDARAPTAYVKRTDELERRLEQGKLTAPDIPSPPLW